MFHSPIANLHLPLDPIPVQVKAHEIAEPLQAHHGGQPILGGIESTQSLQRRQIVRAAREPVSAHIKGLDARAAFPEARRLRELVVRGVEAQNSTGEAGEVR